VKVELEHTYRVDFEYGELVESDATKLLTSFRCEEVAFVVDGVLRQSTLSKELWAIKKRRCNVLFLREPTCRYGHPVEREKVVDKILKNPYRGHDLMQLTTAEMGRPLYCSLGVQGPEETRPSPSIPYTCLQAQVWSSPTTRDLRFDAGYCRIDSTLGDGLPFQPPLPKPPADCLKNALLERTTVSFKKQSSLESIICNASKWGQEWDRKKKWQCDCHTIRHHLGANISPTMATAIPAWWTVLTRLRVFCLLRLKMSPILRGKLSP
jgi:hypothetical protein